MTRWSLTELNEAQMSSLSGALIETQRNLIGHIRAQWALISSFLITRLRGAL